MINIPLATAPENNVVVHAAAGTGKTWLLTSRIIRLLLEGNAPGSILAITFTRKAASEIHERVTERLLGLAACDDLALAKKLTEIGATPDQPIRAAARGLYEKHLSAIYTLRTTTFHAFCQEILRRFPLEADVPPGFELIEATAELEDTAWLTLEQSINREKAGMIAKAMDALLLECRGVTNTRKALDDFLEHRSDWWAYTENASDPVAQSTTRLQISLEAAEGIDSRVVYIQDPAIREQIVRYSELLAGHSTATNKKLIEKLRRAMLDQTPSLRAFSWISEALLTDKGEPRQMNLAQALIRSIGAGGAEELIELHQELTARLLSSLKDYKRQWTLDVSRAWYICGAALLEEYQRLKSERGLLDFSDLEWKTYRLLNRSRHAEWVQYKLDQRIDHLLVDEFQDTNPTQWRLLLPLLEEMAAGDPERRRSVFLVGDEKQSIYRFRRADPRLFHCARHWLQQHAQARTHTQHVSWRSSPAIIRFANLIFHRDGDDNSDATDDYPLQDFHPHDTWHEQLWGRAELLPLIRRKDLTETEMDQTWRNPLEQPRVTDEDARHREEGDLIAGKIGEILGMPVMDGNIVRSLDANDIMILLRDRTHARYYEDALRRAGIPYHGTGRGAFLQSLEVRDLMNLLRGINEPYNDLALASALRSPVFAATEMDLLRLVRNPPGPWRERLARLPTASSPDDALVRAQSLLTRWSDYAGRVPVHDLLDRIYSEGNLVARYIAAATSHLRSRVESNLNRFIELALEVDSGRYPSLSHFLAYLERASEDDSLAPTGSAWNREPRVRVMTIHAAKGLEAPAVFLADAARDTGKRERGSRALIEWSVTDPQPRHFHLVGNKEMLDDVSQALLHQQQWFNRREEANLLYVALTRAKQILYVSGCEPGQGDRGWYGFIEKRMRRAVHTGEAARVGMVLNDISIDDGKSIFNTSARLEFGYHEKLTEEPPKSSVPFKIDPSLTKPFPPAPETGMLNPSRKVRSKDDVPDDSVSATEIRTESQRRGVVIHRMLERLTHHGAARQYVEKQLRREFAEWPDAEVFNAWWQEACGVIDAAALHDLFDPACYRSARNEVPILYRDGDRDIYGIIDRIVTREKEIIVIDYKTHERATSDNIAQLAQDYAVQLRQYGAAARLLWPRKKLRLLLLFTACGGIVEMPL